MEPHPAFVLILPERFFICGLIPNPVGIPACLFIIIPAITEKYSDLSLYGICGSPVGIFNEKRQFIPSGFIRS